MSAKRLCLALPILLLSSAIGQNLGRSRQTPGKDLPLTTAPLALPAALKGKPLISVSEYVTREMPKPTRVFRYSFKGDYEAYVQQLRKQLKGWKEDFERQSQTLTFEREIKQGNVEFQALLLHPTRLIRDEKANAKCRPLPYSQGKGWVWVSYNERRR